MMKMEKSLEQASNMEAGQAGYPVTPTSLSVDEKLEDQLCTSSTDSSTKPLDPISAAQCMFYRLFSLEIYE